MKILNILIIILVAAAAFVAGAYSPFNKTDVNDAVLQHERAHHANAAQKRADFEETLPQADKLPSNQVASVATDLNKINAAVTRPAQVTPAPVETPPTKTAAKTITDSGIEIKTDYWGGGNPADILQVIGSAKSVLDEAFQSGAKNKIWVYQNLERGHPITLYEKGPRGEYKIEISSTQRYWSNYAYQFSHEYCHVRTNYEKPNPKTMWFEEVIGEMCSLYALRRMSETWADNPPYENWRAYAGSLKQYSDDIFKRPENQLPAGQNFAIWFANALPELEQNPQLRGKNSVIAQRLLPLFEAHPELWDSLTYWNQWQHAADDDIWTAFSKWLQAAPTEYQGHISQLIIKLKK